MAPLKTRLSSFDVDVEKFGEPHVPLDTMRSGEGESRSRSRSRSYNFSRLSPPESQSDIEFDGRRTRSSDEAAERDSSKRVHHQHDVGPNPLPLPSSARRGVSANYPPFAPRPLSTPPPQLRDPPPVPPISPAQSRKSIKSMDVLAAARNNMYQHAAYDSTRSLVSTFKEPSGPTFAQKVFEAGKPDLLYELKETKRFKDRKHGVLDLTTLLRMNQHVLQQKLVEQVKVMGERGAWMEIGVGETLHEYCQTVRDLSYMEELANRGRDNDPFLIATTKTLQSEILEDAGLVTGSVRASRISMGHAATDARQVRLPYTKRQSPTSLGVQRLIMALAGALAFVGPFLIAVLLKGQLVRLLVTVCAVVAFSIALAMFSELTPDRTALIAAAYAGVLIVFIGTDYPAWVYS